MDEVGRKPLERRLRHKLSEASTGSTLLYTGLVLVGFELLKAEIIDKVRDFYLIGFDEKGLTYDTQTYKREVESLDPNRLRASCLWLLRRGALDEADLAEVETIRKHRNDVAHEIPRYLIDPDSAIDLSVISKIHRLVVKLGRFWGRTEMSLLPEFDDQEIPDEEIRSGSQLLMEHILGMLSKRDSK